MPNLRTGYVLNNRYRIVQRIGGGGFGDIYRAWDLNLGRACAVKENLETSQAAQRQFEQEAMILAQLSHPNLPRVTDHFVVPGQGQYLVMDYVDGEDLQEMLDRGSGPLAEAQVLAWVEQVCSALAYLHGQSPPIIHRDIKPANIKLAPDGKAYLVDFGIAKVYDPSAKTTRGARAVTPGYSPPEQYGQGRTDGRTDIYALGATLYTLLTGQEPPESVQVSSGQASLLPVRTLNPGVTPVVEVAVQGAMETRPDDRYQEVDELLAALRATRPTPPGTTRTTQPVVIPVNRDLLVRLAGVAVVAVLVVAAIVYFVARAGAVPTPTATPSVQVLTSTSTSILPTRTSSPSTRTAPAPTKTAGPSETEPGNAPTAVPGGLSPGPTPVTIPLDGSDLVRMTNSPDKDYTPSLSLDQRLLFYSTETGGRWHIMQADPNQPGNATQITSGSYNYQSPHPSADSSLVLVTSDRDGDQDIYLVDAETGDVVNQLTDNRSVKDYAPAWLPDYSGFVFTSDKDGNHEVYLQYLDGSPPQNLTNNPAFDGYPSISRNGKQVAFYTNRDGNYEVYVMKLDELRPRRITNDIARDADPVFSPDGEWMVFESERSGNYEIYAVRTDGSELQNLTNHLGNDYVPSFSPDGRWLLFQSDRDGNMELYRLPWTLGEQASENSSGEPGVKTGTNPKDGTELVYVPAGEFLMGSDPKTDPYFYGAEGPPQTVYLDAFWIYRTEVTNAMYQQCAEANACPRPAGNDADLRTDYYDNPSYANYPVVRVSWKNATAYCQWAGGRLPTEAEWEKAGRGTDGRLFPWGDNPPRPELANYGTELTEPVGSYPAGASPYGALDMAGNVIEWVFDYFQPTYYKVSPKENPTGPASGSTRVYRSGAYHNTDTAAIRVVMRGSRSESHSNVDIGFRCVKDE